MNIRSVINHYMTARRTGYTTHLIKTAPENSVILANSKRHADMLADLLHNEGRKDIDVIVPNHSNFDGLCRNKIVLMDNYTIQEIMLHIHTEMERLNKENYELKQKLSRIKNVIGE